MNYITIDNYRINLSTIYSYEPAERNLDNGHESIYLRIRIGGNDSIWIWFENLKQRDAVLAKLDKYTKNTPI